MAALATAGGLVLLGEDGPYLEARPAAEVRRELERLIA